MIIYLLFCFVCFIILMASTKVLDGQVLLDDLCMCLFASIIPLVNIIAVIYGAVLIAVKYGHKRIF